MQAIMCRVLAVSAGAPMAMAIDVAINPRATYLRTNQDNGSLDAVPIVLADLGLGSGERVRLTRLGGFSYIAGGQDDAGDTMVGVFSASAVLLPANQQIRVQDAIEAGADWVSSPTYHGNLPTDIPQDFLIGRRDVQDFVEITIPVGATHLFACAHDSLYYDNGDANGNFKVRIELAPCPADMDGNGVLNLFDFLAFQTLYGNGDPGADFDGSGTLNLFDFLAFQTAYGNGC